MTRTLLTCLLVVGCGSSNGTSPASTPAPETVRPTPSPSAASRRSEEDSVALMTECYRGVNPQIQPLERTDVYCSKIYRRPACGKAWLDMSLAFTTPRMPEEKLDGRALVTAVVDACRGEYCGSQAHATTLATPALCARDTELSKATIIEFVAWLLDQELTFPIEQSQKWARGVFMELWLKPPE